MVKRNRIARKTTPPSPDQWVQEGGIDPEAQQQSTSPTPPAPAPAEDKKKYPHRISFDMDPDQYKRLKWAAFDSGQAMNAILREAIEEWMQSRSY